MGDRRSKPRPKMRDRRSKPRLNMPSTKKRLKWWFRNNYVFLIIVGAVCLIATLILVYEVSRFERMRNMEALLQKSRRDMHWGGITDQDVDVLKKRYPNINWDDQYDRERWKLGREHVKEKRARKKATYKPLRDQQR